MKGIIYFLLLIILSNSCFVQSDKDVHGITQQLDSIVKNYVDSTEFMGSVLIAKNGEILLKKGYGFADIENKIPNTAPGTGIFLSVPITLTVKIIPEQNEKTRWLAILLGTPAEAKIYPEKKGSDKKLQPDTKSFRENNQTFEAVLLH